MKIKIFSYNELTNKAQREIHRLQNSEMSLDMESSIDHALNAAFSIYHLIEWRNKEENNEEKQRIKAHDIIFGSDAKSISPTKNKGLKILHDVVTKQKHVTVSKKAYEDEENEPLLYGNIEKLINNNGDYLTDNDRESLVTNQSRIEVRFGEYCAIDILKDAISEFLVK